MLWYFNTILLCFLNGKCKFIYFSFEENDKLWFIYFGMTSGIRIYFTIFIIFRKMFSWRNDNPNRVFYLFSRPYTYITIYILFRRFTVKLGTNRMCLNVVMGKPCKMHCIQTLNVPTHRVNSRGTLIISKKILQRRVEVNRIYTVVTNL